MFRGDRNHGGFEGSSVDFAFLADGATLDILLDVLSHTGPPEVLLGEGKGVGNSWVSGGRIIMEKLNYPCLQIVVFFFFFKPICIPDYKPEAGTGRSETHYIYETQVSP